MNNLDSFCLFGYIWVGLGTPDHEQKGCRSGEDTEEKVTDPQKDKGPNLSPDCIGYLLLLNGLRQDERLKAPGTHHAGQDVWMGSWGCLPLSGLVHVSYLSLLHAISFL